MRITFPLLYVASLFMSQAATPKSEVKVADASKPEATVEQQVKSATVEIASQSIPYRVTTGKIQLKQEDGKARASIFHVSYERTDIKDRSRRPVLFAFNGGPGSSAVWLHIGVLGPRTIQLPGHGTEAPEPPMRVAENPQSILDVCDLVFVDPVSTGYSRAENDAKPGDFHGLNEDVESIGDFIRRWISEHGRWASPKYLLGESYGGIRVAGLSQHLQSRYGMNLNGVVLMSSLLDFATLQTSQGNDLGYLTYLPSFTGVAHYHGKIKGERDVMIQQSTDFAFGDYAAALLKGNLLDSATRRTIAAKLESFTGIAAATWDAHNLRIDPSFFRAELLRKEGKVLGRFDARVAWDATDRTSQAADYDPSFSLAYGAFSSAMMDYLGNDLGYKEDQPYEILTGKVNPWKWNVSNEIVNMSDRLSSAMRDNPRLRLLVMAGRTDLATPPEAVAYSLRHMFDLPAYARDQISTTRYEAGHMFYLNPPDLEKTRRDLVSFIQASNK